MQKIVGVSLYGDGETYYYDPNNATYNVGDKVVVEVNSTEMLATVTNLQQSVQQDLPKVLRLARPAERAKEPEIIRRADNAKKVAKQKVKALQLDMKIVSSTVSLDLSKVIINFTAEDRVDFRDLLKELATSLKARIELKQIGQRDEVKVKGGLGPCGEICCCKRFLQDFEHVTVKMAKNQGLSLSPTKISGLCGRLMCCLGYENPQYEEILKKMPKVGKKVTTPDGVGTNVYNDILRELVTVKFEDGDNISVEVYPLDKIKFNNQGENNGIQNKSK